MLMLTSHWRYFYSIISIYTFHPLDSVHIIIIQGGTTLLMIAVCKKLTGVLSVLLNYGADIDKRNEVPSEELNGGLNISS